eukprot:gene17472-20847_t
MLSDLHRFSIDTWEWEEIRQTNPIIARNGHSFCAYKKNIILFGGGSFIGFLNDIAIFDTETLKWKQVDANGAIPSGRSKHSASIVGDQLYVDTDMGARRDKGHTSKPTMGTVNGHCRSKGTDIRWSFRF